MKNTIRYILLAIGILLMISNIVFGFLYYRERFFFDCYKIGSSTDLNKLKVVNEDIKGSFFESQFYNNNNITFYGSEKFADYTLCLYISQNHCSTCVKAMLEYYTEYHNIVPDSKFVILANYNQNSIRYIRAEHQIKCKIISTINTNIKIGENKYPCFFIYNKKRHETEMFFFPLKNESEMMKKYFENIKKKYFNQDNK